jgi:molybdate transport system ATP-binding protein
MSLLLKNISLPLAPFTLEMDLELKGRISVIFGPSGAGKTSLLDLVAGLRSAKSAVIQLDGQVLTDTSRGVSVATRQRGIGYVPQDLALFPHLNVRQNLLYGSKSIGESSRPITFERVVEILEIQPLIERGIKDLSGGEKQRVALARALLASPRLLLLDEPLASLDANLKTRIIPYLTRIRDEFRIPMLYVTHDRAEMLALADELVILIDGKVAQSGSVPEVLSRPANLAVAGLLTVETVQPGRAASPS